MSLAPTGFVTQAFLVDVNDHNAIVCDIRRNGPNSHIDQDRFKLRQ